MLLSLPAARAAGLEAQVAEFTRQALVEQAQREGLLEPQAEVRVQPALGQAAAQRRAAADCARPWALQAQELRTLSRLKVSASCPGANTAPLDFVLKGTLSAEVLVAATALPAGKALAEADLLRERRDLALLPDPLSDADAVVGMSPRSSLRAGQALQKRQLAEAILVKRGERLRIVARNETIEVQAPGEALDNGALGAVIRVRNSNTGRVISARVTGAGLVEPSELGRTP
ncbi:flagellar basal body P-ring formation chaperone FlgA [Roseateles violae]|uniref:Flagella basal body P-ring formation protein FlgA n=1 Tax=Roseateles violae TaxID=3058042 RepID=A0ABT8DU81_9BURK|nr:flagellar basal body P-ring formation chaperone FlgA [Pelomonas sp. PFR6]MDN3921558.1 flagellar basal body P-ring formation chaperone FlgA [Pelomonas sp. PFR6]